MPTRQIKIFLFSFNTLSRPTGFGDREDSSNWTEHIPVSQDLFLYAETPVVSSEEILDSLVPARPVSHFIPFARKVNKNLKANGSQCR